MKDHREHAVATLFGRVTVRLRRFRCAVCGAFDVGIDWPPHCRSPPELERLQAHLSALMTYRTAADILEQMFLVDTGRDKETIRRLALNAGALLRDSAAMRLERPTPAITVTGDSTFIRSCEDGERHLDVWVGNVETASGDRQVFGAVAGCRRRSTKRLTTEEGDRLARIAKVYSIALNIYHDPDTIGAG